MTIEKTPRITVGLPIYNGQKYLEKSIQSILSQTLKDFELIIIDNNSSDDTDKICREYSKRDARIRYYQNDSNIGASANHNKTLDMARGEYFVWASYDDIRHPDYLMRCSAELDKTNEVSVCHCLTRYIDADGNETSRQETQLELGVQSPSIRFKEMSRMDHKVEMILGLMRTDMMKKTKGLGPFSDSDRVLMAEMALYGPFVVLPEYLFYRREHAENSSKVYKSRQSRMAWFDPKLKGKISFPHFRQFREYMASISRVPLSSEDRIKCNVVMMTWLFHNKDRLQRDLIHSFRTLVIKTLFFLKLRSQNH